jgi:phospholipid transport system substrate-binding protein
MILLLLVTVAASGQARSPATAPDPAAVVQTTADEVLAAVAKERHRYDGNPEPLREQLDAILAPRVAYDAIAGNVMGDFRSRFDVAQTEAFRRVFRRSVVELYSDAMVALKAEEVDVEPAVLREEGRATVRMDVRTADGERFVIHYALARDENHWKVRNLLVDGINLGVTFRNQFASLMEEAGGDPEVLLARWAEVQRSDFEATP